MSTGGLARFLGTVRGPDDEPIGLAAVLRAVAVAPAGTAGRATGLTVDGRPLDVIGSRDGSPLEALMLSRPQQPDAPVGDVAPELPCAFAVLRAGRAQTVCGHVAGPVGPESFSVVAEDGGDMRGASGSPLVDAEGRLIGVVVGPAGEAAIQAVDRHAVERLLAAAEAPPPFNLAGGVSSDVVDPTRAMPPGWDQLGLTTYAVMFAAVIADTTTPMPLSIGLFGGPGSGKSWFMAMLRGEIAKLAAFGDPRYVRDVVQIGFSASHYGDSNLAASLGDAILEQLTGLEGFDDERRARLRDELLPRLQWRREAQIAIERAREETLRLRGELDQAAAERARAVAKLVSSAVPPELLSRPSGKENVEQSRLLAEEAGRARHDARLIRSLMEGRWLLLLVALGVAAAVAVLGLVIANGWVVASGVLAALPTAQALGRHVPAALRAAQRSARRLEQAYADDHFAEDLAALRRAETQETVLQSQLEQVEQRLAELGRLLLQLQPGEHLYSSAVRRAAAAGHGGQLELLSTIRRDLEVLIALMRYWREAPGADADGFRPIERIVVYVDNVDGCTPEQVTELLAVVNLVLTLDLFAVVVAADPGRLLRAVGREYDAGSSDDPGMSSPRRYLEKVFSIPFALPPLTGSAFARLVRFLAVTEEDAASEAEPVPEASLPEPPQVEAASEVAAVRADEPHAEHRALTPRELEILTALAPLVQTPRETTRLLNVYRMIRATRDLTLASTFLGDERHAGEHEAVAVLLGVLSGAPERYEALVRILAGRPSGDRWADVVAGLDGSEWGGLTEALAGVTPLVRLPDLEAFKRWAPPVARFSFRVAAPG